MIVGCSLPLFKSKSLPSKVGPIKLGEITPYENGNLFCLCKKPTCNVLYLTKLLLLRKIIQNIDLIMHWRDFKLWTLVIKSSLFEKVNPSSSITWLNLLTTTKFKNSSIDKTSRLKFLMLGQSVATMSPKQRENFLILPPLTSISARMKPQIFSSTFIRVINCLGGNVYQITKVLSYCLKERTFPIRKR